MPTYKPETVIGLKKMYAERRSTVEYMIKHGSTYERTLAMLVKEAATGVSC